MAEPQIVAIGGLGEDGEAGVLIEFVLRLTGKEQPRVCLIPTASAEKPEFLIRFYEQLSGRRTLLPRFVLPVTSGWAA